MQSKNTRRRFLELSLWGGLSIPFLGSTLSSCESPSNKPASKNPGKKLNILILGGTSFLGPHQIAYALERGHKVSTFTRGKTKPTVHTSLFTKVESLVGDRANDLSALENRKWDVVIDNSGHDVEWTKKSAKLLKDNVDLYVFTSSTGVYYPYLGTDFKEDYAVLLKEPATIEEEDMKLEYWYGVMKSNSEIAARDEFGADRTIVVRPTYMIGPGDKSDRFIHWPIRLAKGGETLVPGKKGDPIQYIDVRDTAEWMIRLIEERKVGTYNAVGPTEVQDMYSFIEEAQATFDVQSTFVKIDDYQFLKDNNIPYLVPWIMPEGNNIGSAKASNLKAKANGLTFRSLKESVLETHEWWNTMSQERRDQYELKEDNLLLREADLIAKWKAIKNKK